MEEQPHFLGRHTALAHAVLKPAVWRRIPYLRENHGRAPPIILVVGDRRRVVAIARKLHKPVTLPETIARCYNRSIPTEHLPSTIEFGRVAMIIGEAESVPVLVVETQMGASAVQIVLNEILSDELTANEYRVGRRQFNLTHKVVIRLGTAGGMNCENATPLRIGDVVNATHSIGATGADMQSLLRLDFWHPEAPQEFRDRWLKLGSDFTYTKGGYPKVECSREVVDAIESVGTTMPGSCYQRGGNITKDSLYAELGSETFIDLCRTENCRTTEMELSAVAVAAHQHSARFGMLSAIVGMLPGSSFGQDEKMKRLGEQRAIEVGLRCLRNLL